MKTVVYQSYRTQNVPAWINTCLTSVQDWANGHQFDYRFYDDEIFERVPPWFLEKAGKHLQIATDLGRLLLARELLDEGYDRAVWLDADILVFDPAGFSIPITEEFAFGREIWVQPKTNGGIKVYRNVHNAVSVYCQNNSFLDFYIHSSLRILGRAEGRLVPQIIGTKFLTAQHNMISFPLLDEVGMASPRVVRDLATGSGPALDLLQKHLHASMRAINLCSSFAGDEIDGVALTEPLLEQACKTLLALEGGLKLI